jgi:hypothetical protein
MRSNFTLLWYSAAVFFAGIATMNPNAVRTTLYLCGDSTMAENGGGALGAVGTYYK